LTGTFRVASFTAVTIAALIQLLISAIAVAAMVAVAAVATRGRGAPPLDDAAARALLDDEFPGCALDSLWIASDGLGAIARSGDEALVLGRMGDGYVARRVPWAQAEAVTPRDGKVRLNFHEFGAPGAILAMAAWPPREKTA